MYVHYVSHVSRGYLSPAVQWQLTDGDLTNTRYNQQSCLLCIMHLLFTP